MNITLLETVETAVTVQVKNRRGRLVDKQVGVKLIGGRTYGPVPESLALRLEDLSKATRAADDAEGVLPLPILGA